MTRSLTDLAWPFATTRLGIRLAVDSDADATWPYRRLDAVSEWTTTRPTDLDDYRRSFLDPARLARTLVVERDGEVVGDLMLLVEDAWAQTEVRERAVGVQAELGWSLDPAHGGNGYATEAVEALIRISFDGLGLRRVHADCFAANEPSWRLMERVGMRREEHEVRGSLHRSGEWLDGFRYALLADEWRAARG